MTRFVRHPIRMLVLALFSLVSIGYRANALPPGTGYELNRYQPTRPGEWTFLVDHPWYSSTRRLAAGLTLNYARLPLQLVDSQGNSSQELIPHQLLGDLEFSVSFLDRINLSAGLGLGIYEQRGATVESLQPQAFFQLGDLRLRGMVRLWGQPLRQAFSAHLGVDVWLPLHHWTQSNTDALFAGDPNVRVLPKLVLAGLYKSFLWSSTLGFLYRPDATAELILTGYSFPLASSVGSTLQLGVAGAYYNPDLRLSIGPELLLTERVTGNDAWSTWGTNLEILLGAQYNIAHQVQIGVAAGPSVLRTEGGPSFRALLRVAYAPMAKTIPSPRDQDQDGIPDAQDACPTARGPVRSTPPGTNGCPDTDGDGLVDIQDACPTVPAGDHPDPKRPGCPLQDRDNDGVSDDVDLCPDQPAGLLPDPQKPGCPLPDRDHDQVADAVDACPDQAGSPSLDPKKNGCPGLIEVKSDKIVILSPVFFATNKDVILPKSNPVLRALTEALAVTPQIKHLCVHGHTDTQGNPDYNQDLSARRAASVVTWLSKHGISAGRLDSKGFGETWPIATNKTARGRAKNRRVDFSIVGEKGCAEVQPTGVVDEPSTRANKKRR